MTGNCLVDFEATSRGFVTITLNDLTGKRICEIQELLIKGVHTYSLSGIKDGVYLLKIKSDKYYYSANLISCNSASVNTEIKHIKTIPVLNIQSIASNPGKLKSFKTTNTIIVMKYNVGDILKLTGKSGTYRTIFMIVPTQTQTVTFNFADCTDADSNHYAIIQIGTQIWMAENLKTTKYRNGNAIDPGSYCCYNNDCSINNNIYGKLYNWYAVTDTDGICPKGWHVPSHKEWTTLERDICAGGNCDSIFPDDTVTQDWRGTVEGGKLKVACSVLWKSPNSGATNETGFTALPGGYRNYDGSFYSINFFSTWWTASKYSSAAAWCRIIKNTSATIYRACDPKADCFSLRCVKN